MDTLYVHHSEYHGLTMAMELIWRPSTALMPIYEVLGREGFSSARKEKNRCGNEYVRTRKGNARESLSVTVRTRLFDSREPHQGYNFKPRGTVILFDRKSSMVITLRTNLRRKFSYCLNFLFLKYLH